MGNEKVESIRFASWLIVRKPDNMSKTTIFRHLTIRLHRAVALKQRKNVIGLTIVPVFYLEVAAWL